MKMPVGDTDTSSTGNHVLAHFAERHFNVVAKCHSTNAKPSNYCASGLPNGFAVSNSSVAPSSVVF
jgi:hypothetical protein